MWFCRQGKWSRAGKTSKIALSHRIMKLSGSYGRIAVMEIRNLLPVWQQCVLIVRATYRNCHKHKNHIHIFLAFSSLLLLFDFFLALSNLNVFSRSGCFSCSPSIVCIWIVCRRSKRQTDQTTTQKVTQCKLIRRSTCQFWMLFLTSFIYNFVAVSLAVLILPICLFRLNLVSIQIRVITVFLFFPLFSWCDPVSLNIYMHICIDFCELSSWLCPMHILTGPRNTWNQVWKHQEKQLKRIELTVHWQNSMELAVNVIRFSSIKRYSFARLRAISSFTSKRKANIFHRQRDEIENNECSGATQGAPTTTKHAVKLFRIVCEHEFFNCMSLRWTFHWVQASLNYTGEY